MKKENKRQSSILYNKFLTILVPNFMPMQCVLLLVKLNKTTSKNLGMIYRIFGTKFIFICLAQIFSFLFEHNTMCIMDLAKSVTLCLFNTFFQWLLHKFWKTKIPTKLSYIKNNEIKTQVYTAKNITTSYDFNSFNGIIL